MNQGTYIGNVGRDPEQRTGQQGEIWATFSMAISNGQNRPTQWISVSCYRENAQRVLKYLHKGDRVAVIGRSTASAWIGQDGMAKGELRVNAEKIEFLGGRREEAPAAEASAEEEKPAAPAEPTPVDDPDELPF